MKSERFDMQSKREAVTRKGEYYSGSPHAPGTTKFMTLDVKKN